MNVIIESHKEGSPSGDFVVEITTELDLNLMNCESNERSKPVSVCASSFKHMKVLVPDAYQSLHGDSKKPKMVSGIATGFAALDAMTDGMQRGDLIVVAARPSMGKTTFALNLAKNVALHGTSPHVTALFSLKISAEKVALRMLAMQANVSLDSLRKADVSQDSWRQLAAASNDLAKMNILIHDISPLSVLALCQQCRSLDRDHKLDIVIIDHLQAITSSLGGELRKHEMSELVYALKNLAKELNVPVVVLSQVDSMTEFRADKRPYLSDLCDGKYIEKYADMIVFLYRDEVYNSKPSNKGDVELIIARNRDGATGTITLDLLSESLIMKGFTSTQACGSNA